MRMGQMLSITSWIGCLLCLTLTILLHAAASAADCTAALSHLPHGRQTEGNCVA